VGCDGFMFATGRLSAEGLPESFKWADEREESSQDGGVYPAATTGGSSGVELRSK
jgi:hypothetical protein